MRAIPGFGGYSARADGLIQAHPRVDRLRRYHAGRILRPWFGPRGGYGVVRLSVNGAAKTVYVHVLIALAFMGPPPVGHEVDHIDDDPTNNTAANLRYVTHAENCAKQARRWRRMNGQRPTAAAKLTSKSAAMIRSSRLPSKEITRRYGVTRQQVWNIRNGKDWAWLSKGAKAR